MMDIIFNGHRLATTTSMMAYGTATIQYLVSLQRILTGIFLFTENYSRAHL
jgi:hypothetical protein